MLSSRMALPHATPWSAGSSRQRPVLRSSLPQSLGVMASQSPAASTVSGVAFGVAAAVTGAVTGYAVFKLFGSPLSREESRAREVVEALVEQAKYIGVIRSEFDRASTQIRKLMDFQFAGEAAYRQYADEVRSGLEVVAEHLKETSWTASIVAQKVGCAEHRDELSFAAKWHRVPVTEAYELIRQRVSQAPECPRYAWKFAKGDPLGVLDEARMHASEGSQVVGPNRVRLLELAKKFGVLLRNEWAMDPECATELVYNMTREWTEEKRQSVREWKGVRERFVRDLVQNRVFDDVSDADPKFEHFLGEWERTLQPESKGWPLSPAFEEFQSPEESSQSQSA